MVARQQTSPKTVLGFFAIVLGLLGAGAVSVVAVLATQEDLRYLIPVILIVVVAIFIVVLLVVLLIVVFGDPTRLMLGEVSGSEYRAYQEMILGDSISGAQPAITSPLGRRDLPQVNVEGTPGRELLSGDKDGE